MTRCDQCNLYILRDLRGQADLTDIISNVIQAKYDVSCVSKVLLSNFKMKIGLVLEGNILYLYDNVNVYLCLYISIMLIQCWQC